MLFLEKKYKATCQEVTSYPYLPVGMVDFFGESQGMPRVAKLGGPKEVGKEAHGTRRISKLSCL